MVLGIKGIFYQAIKNVFPNVVDILDPAPGKHFEGDIDADAWYDAGPYVKTVEFLFGHVSPEAMAFLGNEFVEILRERFAAIGVRTVEDFAGKAPRLYHEFIRGREGEGWQVEEFRPGRIVIKETGFLPYVDFISGVIKRTLEALGGVNVRVTVLDDRAKGAEANRYVAEWLEAETG